jgi:hypothetical protein
MNMPRFNAEFALSEPVRSHRPASVPEAATDKTVVSPQQTLIPPGALTSPVLRRAHRGRRWSKPAAPKTVSR